MAKGEDLAAMRRDVVAYLRRQIVGPAGPENEVLQEPPDRRYLMGTLYPRGIDLQSHTLDAGEAADEVTDTDDETEEGGFAEDPISYAYRWLPSSLGISFFTDARTIKIRCSAARYQTRHGKPRSWAREQLAQEEIDLPQESESVFDDRAELHVRRRPLGIGQLITVALANAYEAEDNQKAWDQMLFQVGFEIEVKDGQILEYPSVRLNSRDEEEQELRLQYRHARTYAVGHGCAAQVLDRDDEGRVTRVVTEIMPWETVPSVRAGGTVDAPVLNLKRLSDPSVPTDQLRTELSDFAEGYKNWYRAQIGQAEDLPEWAGRPAARVLARIDTVISRVEQGIVALTGDPVAMEAFRIANRAMALQMRHAEKDLAGSRRNRDEPVPEVAEPSTAYRWHPFQLAYFLLVARGLIDEGHDDRGLVDLIWFPTGGGKTEAYLLAASFEIALRRLRYGAEGGGTTVISRYTLSLLTTQQFQRTAGLICAMEYLRRGKDAECKPALGGPITIGLWVGEGTTPNAFLQAAEDYQTLLQLPTPDDRFLLERCPWCGTEIVPRQRSSAQAYGISAEAKSFRFFCPRSSCEFNGRDGLPISVIDEALYAAPPTFLLGTVDKFARLAWEPKAGVFFGGHGVRRPSLIIQDELHLLSGPLGTTVGLYEAAIVELCSWAGVSPKIIASTATIRRASDQVAGLYRRPVQLFPPAGLDARDSYFATPDGEKPGRLYLGIMAQGHTSSTTTVHTSAALSQAPMEIADENSARDAYWTQVAYHHSMRELGRTVTLARDDIGARLKFLGKQSGQTRAWGEHLIKELTSNVKRAEQPGLLEQLERSYPDNASVSFLACTNMLSVGIDVKRLALMLMMGQPKSTSEYIQATSRVGRHSTPGLVVTIFRSTKPRDRSHYETFGTYHRALYRHVEPTSVTPWSLASRKRALHAVLVILVRHGLGLAGNGQAGEVLNYRSELQGLRERILESVRIADRHELAATAKELDLLIREWIEAAEAATGSKKRLHYKWQSRAESNLLRQFSNGDGLWKTLNSMRNVDHESLIDARGEQ